MITLQVDPKSAQAVRESYQHAHQRLAANVPKSTVEAELQQRGLSSEAAKSVVDDTAAERARQYRSAGAKWMVIGGVICAIGLAVTVGSYATASLSGGGRYTIAWGAIAVGAFRFFRGLSLFLKK